eukprot:jgi/Mesvir1/14411/Mv09797-RA.1
MEKTVHYRSPDPIQNLKVRVTVTQLSGRRIRRDQPQQAAEGSVSGQNANEPSERRASNQGEPDSRRTTGPSDRRLSQSETVLDMQSRLQQTHTEVFGWQRKVFSTREVKRLRETEDAQLDDMERRYKQEILATNIQGSFLYTCLQGDAFTKANEMLHAVTTSRAEGSNPLVQAVFGQLGKLRHAAVRHKSMFLMAATDDADIPEGGGEERVLCHIRAYPNGSFDMKPGFNEGLAPYKFMTAGGTVYEYSLSNAAAGETALEVRQEKLVAGISEKVAHLRRQAFLEGGFAPPPGPSPDAVRLVIYGEIVAGKDFKRDYLYVEYFVKYDPQVWECPPDMMQGLHGITQVSKVMPVTLDEDVTSGPGKRTALAHFCFPLELMFVCQEGNPFVWPTIFFQVCSYDPMDRFSVEGYGYLSLAGCCPGVNTHYVRTVKPQGTVKAQVQNLFVGGSPELDDITYLLIPEDLDVPILSRYGYKMLTSGTLKIRTNAILHSRPKGVGAVRKGGLGGATPQKPSARKPSRSAMDVIERAKRRVLEKKLAATLSPGEGGERPMTGRSPPRRGRGGTSRQPPTPDDNVSPNRAPLRPRRISSGSSTAGDIAPSSRGIRHDKENESPPALAAAAAQVASAEPPPGDRSPDPEPALWAVVIDSHPSDVAAEAGQSATFAVEAHASSQGGEQRAGVPLSYEWFFNGRPLRKRGGPTRGERSATLVLDDVQVADAGGYACRVRCGDGEGEVDTHAAQLSVQDVRAPPSIQQQPVPMEVVEGEPAAFRVVALGVAPIFYTWRRDGEVLGDYEKPELRIQAATRHDVGKYSCLVTNKAGSVLSQEAELVVHEPDILTRLVEFLETRETRLVELFRQADKDGSGKLNAVELAQMVKEIQPGCTEKQLRHFKVMVDTDGDGQVSYKELTQALQQCKELGVYLRDAGGSNTPQAVNLSDLEQKLATAARSKGEGGMRATFDKYDRNGDGELDQEEVLQMVKKLMPGLSPKEIRYLMLHFYNTSRGQSGDDDDGYGITYEEFRRALKPKEGLQHQRTDLKRVPL